MLSQGQPSSQKYIEGISPKTALFTPGNSSPVAFIDKTRRDHVLGISAEKATEEERSCTDEHSCVVTPETTLPPMSEKSVWDKTSCEGFQQIELHQDRVQKWIALVVQNVVDTVSKMPFLNKFANRSLWLATLPKGMKVTLWIASSQACFRCRATGKSDMINAVQIYNAPQSEKEIMDRRYDTKRRNVNVQGKDWMDTGHFSNEYKQVNLFIL